MAETPTKETTAAPVTEAPETFLKALSEMLKAQSEVDVDLAGILATHILKSDAATNAVVLAKDAILKLAEKRASLPATETADA